MGAWKGQDYIDYYGYWKATPIPEWTKWLFWTGIFAGIMLL